jgi:hypothetical protein
MCRLKRWAFRGLAVIALGSLVPACKTQSQPTTVNVTAIFAQGNQYPIPRVTVLYVDFDQPLNPATVTQANFVLTLLGGVGALPHAQPPTYNPVRQEVTVYPQTFGSGTPGVQTYFLTVSTSVMDANNDVCSGAQVGFEVVVSGDTDAPSFTGGTNIVATAGGPPGSGMINLSWSAATDATGPITYYVYGSTVLGGEDYGIPVAAGVSAPSVSTTITLTSGVVYYFVVRARDAAGNEDANVTQSAGLAAP